LKPSQNKALSGLHKSYKRYIKENPYARLTPTDAYNRKLHDTCRELALKSERLNSLVEMAKGERKNKLKLEHEKVKATLAQAEAEYKKILGY